MSDFKNFERHAWEQKAARYQGTWGRVTNQVNETVLTAGGVGRGTMLLDCGCGPGHFCHAAAERGAVVTGADYSPAMVQIANANYPEIKFVVEDAGKLSFADSQFDVVTLNYVLLHLENQEAGLREASRVLKARGRLVYTIWCDPANSPGFSLMFGAVREFADLSVIPPAQDIFLFSDDHYVKQYLPTLGFGDITITRFESYAQAASADEFFDSVQAGIRVGGLIDLQRPEIKAKIRDRIVKNLEAFRTKQGFKVPMPSLVVSAKKA